MKTFSDILQARRSVRAYKDTTIKQEDVEKLIEAAMLSPRAKNIPGVSLVVIDDKELLHTLSNCKAHGAGFVADAALAFVVAADTQKSVAWIEDASIVAITLQYAAEELGLSSCWSQIRERKTEEGGPASEYVKTHCDLPPHFEVEAIIAVGYPNETLEPHSEEELSRENIRYNTFLKPYY